MRVLLFAVVAVVLVLLASSAGAQGISHRGAIEGRAVGFPQVAPNDTTRVIADVLVREEVFVRPAHWFELAGGVDLRASSYDQVNDEWRLDVDDRGVRRPRVAVRRLTATVLAGGFALDVGKQFIRWARTDILNPTDRFAPRDFLNVIDADFLPVIAVRPSIQMGDEIVEAVWVPQLTPSRLPLFDQRWTVVPSDTGAVSIIDGGSDMPRRSQHGVRWRHAGARFGIALSYFDGFNHLPSIEARDLPDALAIELTRVYQAIRTYGVDLSVPTGWLTLKGEAAYFTSPASSPGEEYVLYVVEVERQTGEWLLAGGYAGEVVTQARDAFRFAPDRGLARSFIGRVSYTVDPRRTVVIEGAVRQRGEGFYVKGEYSRAVGQHWRWTATGVGLGGDETDFLGQYRRNAHGSIVLRFSF